jgi:hypothetical protein
LASQRTIRDFRIGLRLGWDLSAALARFWWSFFFLIGFADLTVETLRVRGLPADSRILRVQAQLLIGFPRLSEVRFLVH